MHLCSLILRDLGICVVQKVSCCRCHLFCAEMWYLVSGPIFLMGTLFTDVSFGIMR